MSFKHLYNDLRPRAYEISITPDIEAREFTGRVNIKAELVVASASLTLHGHNLKVKQATVNKKPAKVRYSAEDEYLILEVGEILDTGQVSIDIDYEGKISTTAAHGLYLSTYQEDGKKHEMLATQLESTYARNLFPSIDEPEAKAIFSLTTVIPTELEAISNTLPVSNDTKDKVKTVTFAITPKMSTYLLALIVGQMDYKEKISANGTIVRTYAVPSQIKYADGSVDLAVKLLDFYEDYFDIPYPLPNLNQVALPDVEAGVGAMENWGCVVYRADSLLINPEESSRDMLTYNAVVISHELAHQWFGNLVTMKWWDELWLNEGFAAFIEYLSIDHILPEWLVWEEFLANDYARAIKQDAMQHTHAVRTPINHPKEIAEVFDDITYRKGSSSIRMLWHYLGPEAFRRGLQVYLKRHAYGTATSQDLWRALEETSAQPVQKFMDAWTTQEGHPIVDYGKADHMLNVRQLRFAFLPAKQSSDIWPIPLTLDGEVVNFDSPITSFKAPKDLLLNKGGGGFFRVHYKPEDLQKLGAQNLEAMDVITILSDVGDQNIAGLYSTVELLDLQLLFKNHDRAGVWDVLAGNFGKILTVFNEDSVHEHLKGYGAAWLDEHYTKTSWQVTDDASHNDALRQLTILGLATKCDVDDARSQAFALFEQAQAGEQVHPDLRSYAYVQAIRHNEQKYYSWLLDRYLKVTHNEEERRLAGAMTSVKSEKLMDQSLEFMMSKNVRLQDAYIWLVGGLRNRFQRERTWEFIKKHWPWIEKNYGRTVVISSLVTSFGSAFANRAIAKDIENFFKDKDTAGIQRSIEKGLEIINYQANWREREGQTLEQYFQNYR